MRKKYPKAICIGLCIGLFFAILLGIIIRNGRLVVQANQVTILINDGNIYIKKDYENNRLVIERANGDKSYASYDDTIIITGTSTGENHNCVWINTGCTVVIRDLRIEAPEDANETTTAFGIDCSSEEDTTVNLILSGNNYLRGGNLRAGLFVKDGSSLIISAETDNETDSLTAVGGYRASGIGANQNDKSGSITINSGTVTAIGGIFGSGIGGGDNVGGGQITINGGVVYAQGGENATGIGNGANEVMETIVINGGTVTAVGGSYKPGIGNSRSPKGGEI